MSIHSGSIVEKAQAKFANENRIGQGKFFGIGREVPGVNLVFAKHNCADILDTVDLFGTGGHGPATTQRLDFVFFGPNWIFNFMLGRVYSLKKLING